MCSTQSSAFGNLILPGTSQFPEHTSTNGQQRESQIAKGDKDRNRREQIRVAQPDSPGKPINLIPATIASQCSYRLDFTT